MTSPTPDYFRRDQKDGISPPDLADTSTYAEHVVHARGIRTRFTSLSTDAAKIRDFGPQLWCLLQPKIYDEGHTVITFEELLNALRLEARSGSSVDRERAARAIPRVRKNKEALVNWSFDISRVDPKDLLVWAQKRVRPYFAKR